jgi:hypothetical protein
MRRIVIRTVGDDRVDGESCAEAHSGFLEDEMD